MRLLVSIFSPKDMSNCSNGGVSSKANSAIVYFNKEDLTKEPEEYFANINRQDGIPELVIKARKISGCEQLYLTAYPVNDLNLGVNEGGMFGGNFVYTSDSRFPKIGDHSYPIPIHDRFE